MPAPRRRAPSAASQATPRRAPPEARRTAPRVRAPPSRRPRPRTRRAPRSRPAPGRSCDAHAIPRRGRYVTRMLSSSPDVRAELADAFAEYQASANVAQLLARLQEIASLAPTPDALADAAEPFRQIPEVAGPLYERIVAERPTDARALVILASAYWLSGRGP